MLSKLFLGTRVSPELRSHLGGVTFDSLKLIPFQGKEYLGFYLENSFPTVHELRTLKSQLTALLETHFPELRIRNSQIVIFPQVFVG